MANRVGVKRPDEIVGDVHSKKWSAPDGLRSLRQDVQNPVMGGVEAQQEKQAHSGLHNFVRLFVHLDPIPSFWV